MLRLAQAPQFLDVNPDYLLALDAAGRLIGHNRRAQLLLQGLPALAGRPLLGQPLPALLEVSPGDLGRFMAGRPAEQRAVMLSGGRQLLFMAAMPPPAAARVPHPVPAAPRLPAPLAALSGGDARLDRQIERAARLANSPVSLLITGETGSGKEYFAKALHAASERRASPFVAVNCAAIPEGLIESELFGHLPGSFTGAGPRAKRGLIQSADGGTLFLDEVGDMPLGLQARLLRVLAEREVTPIGAARPVPVNIRVIAATHAPLEQRVREGRFRDDLYYRLNGAHFVLPPLRERSDLGTMIDRLLAAGDHLQPPVRLAPEALALLLAHRWPGNLRELRNALDYARSVCSHGLVEPADLPDAVQATAGPAAPPPAAAQAEALLQLLRDAHWNVAAVARQLGCARMTLYRRIARWGIRSPNARDAEPPPH